MLTEEIKKEFFAGNTLQVARALLGQKLVYGSCSGIIVETEAYRDDEASHYVTRPSKGVLLKETYGCVYIYMIYGMYHCLNFTTEKQGVGAVLIRAVEPLDCIELMKTRRNTTVQTRLTNGPGKLVQAFAIDPAHHGEPVGQTIKLMAQTERRGMEVATGKRIGITKSKNLPWRFWIKDNPYVSR
jgi:DNA-3-methyladenine glycosylase